MTLPKTAIIRQKWQSFDEQSWHSKFVWKNMDSASEACLVLTLFY
jgi:hypothetical protein